MKIVTVLLGAMLLTSCGYKFQGGGSILPPDIKKIYIPIAENRSTEARLATLLTEAMKDRFERFGVLSVVDSAAEADAVLRTTILKVGRDTQSTTSQTDTALQLDTSVTIASELKRTSGVLLWRNPQFTVRRAVGTASGGIVTSSADFASGSLGAGDVGALSSRELSRGQEQEAMNLLAEQAARLVYDQAVSPDF